MTFIEILKSPYLWDKAHRDHDRACDEHSKMCKQMESIPPDTQEWWSAHKQTQYLLAKATEAYQRTTKYYTTSFWVVEGVFVSLILILALVVSVVTR